MTTYYHSAFPTESIGYIDYPSVLMTNNYGGLLYYPEYNYFYQMPNCWYGYYYYYPLTNSYYYYDPFSLNGYLKENNYDLNKSNDGVNNNNIEHANNSVRLSCGTEDGSETKISTSKTNLKGNLESETSSEDSKKNKILNENKMEIPNNIEEKEEKKEMEEIEGKKEMEEMEEKKEKEENLPICTKK